MLQVVARASRRHRKEVSDGTPASAGKHFPHGEHGALGRRYIAGSERSFLMTQLVFMDLVVDAPWGDPEKVGRL
jgi:hypothetical protein